MVCVCYAQLVCAVRTGDAQLVCVLCLWDGVGGFRAGTVPDESGSEAGAGRVIVSEKKTLYFVNILCGKSYFDKKSVPIFFTS